MKRSLAMLTLCAGVLALGACATAPPTSAPRAGNTSSIMFGISIDKATGNWTHGQVVAGFKDYDACDAAVPSIGAEAQLKTRDDPNAVWVFLCPRIDIEGIKKEQEAAQKEDVAPPAPPLDQDTREPATTL